MSEFLFLPCNTFGFIYNLTPQELNMESNSFPPTAELLIWAVFFFPCDQLLLDFIDTHRKTLDLLHPYKGLVCSYSA